jgi:ferric-dicitrate binding protein FerR (iron transport regulator)
MQQDTMQDDTIKLITEKAELAEQAISAAMEWLVLTWSGEETLAAKQYLQADISNWRNADVTHEQAWQYMAKKEGRTPLYFNCAFYKPPSVNF